MTLNCDDLEIFVPKGETEEEEAHFLRGQRPSHVRCHQQPGSTLGPEVSGTAMQSPPLELRRCQPWPCSNPPKRSESQPWVPVPRRSLLLLLYPEAGSCFPKVPSLCFLRVSAPSSRTCLTNSLCIPRSVINECRFCFHGWIPTDTAMSKSIW